VGNAAYLAGFRNLAIWEIPVPEVRFSAQKTSVLRERAVTRLGTSGKTTSTRQISDRNCSIQGISLRFGAAESNFNTCISQLYSGSKYRGMIE
jgi:hypothetical protein